MDSGRTFPGTTCPTGIQALLLLLFLDCHKSSFVGINRYGRSFAESRQAYSTSNAAKIGELTWSVGVTDCSHVFLKGLEESREWTAIGADDS